MNEYRYTPLEAAVPEIRVLTLFPGDFSSAIIVSLSTTSLAEIGTLRPSLEALSYVWGPFHEREIISIVVEGKKNVTPLSVTAKLAEALRYLRNSTTARLLWIDALCINQEDVEERNSQVRLMAQIYSTVDRVIVWVGPKSDDSDVAIHRISQLASRVKVDWQTSLLHPITDELDWADHAVPLPFSDAEYTALVRFYSRDWFTRLWVWQEAHLAGDARILCGTHAVSWSAVRTGVLCLGLKPRAGMAEWPAPEAAFGICAFSWTEDCTLSALLHHTKESICSDPRDRIYALLSFLDDDIRSRIIPDYNMTAREVYKDVVRQHLAIGHRDGPRLLSTVEIDIHDRIPETPSWIPRWNLPRAAKKLHHGKAALATRPYMSFLSAAEIAALGVYVTQISQVNAINIPNDASELAVINEIRRLKEQVLPGHDDPNVPQRLYSFLETLTANYVAERHHPAFAWWPSTADFQPFLNMVFGQSPLDELLVTRVLRNIRQFAQGRAFCTTTSGSFCLSLSGALPGDIVTVLLGCDSPMLLRPASSTPDPDCPQYWVVGEAFCHGIMDGEALLGPLPEPWRLVIRHNRPSNVDLTAFWNEESGKLVAEDPRLGMLGKGWRRESQKDDEYRMRFVWENDGECAETWEDPRLSADELRLRGVQLKSFRLL